jgi:hypothetical protein
MLQTSAGWLSGREEIPTSLRAVLGYYADSGVFDARSLLLKRRVDEEVEAMLADSFSDIEAAVAEEFGYGYAEFSYDTKLLLPAQLTLGYLYRTLDEREHERAEEMTHLAIDALLDGDMRDAINDAEFADFEVDFPVDTSERRRIAEIAQELLQARVEESLASYPHSVRETYERAVAISERHQEQDEQFRELMAAAREGEASAREQIRAEYRDATLDEQPLSPDESSSSNQTAVFTDDERAIPYLKTQYDRVGVIYDAMIEMYRDTGFPIADSFQRSIVLAIIGAQVWLDDIEDYEADMRDGQLTPVTAEYLLADSDRQAHVAVREVSREYLDRARREATEADSTLTGIATEYIRREGAPEQLPGAR